MKQIYETFSEMADDFVRGENWTHTFSDHTPDQCLAWQHGVREFAKWLDACGVRIIQNPEIYETLWNDIRRFKPEGFAACGKADESGK